MSDSPIVQEAARRLRKRAERRELDAYMTPAWAVRAFLASELIPTKDVTILEPACGDGSILRELVRAGFAESDLFATELDPLVAEQTRKRFPAARVFTTDFLKLPVRYNGAFDLVITNPPYASAFDFLKRAFELVRPGGRVAFLLRLNFLASQKRAKWMKANTPDVRVLPRRPSFTGGGTDATEYAWMVWRPGLEEPATLKILALEDCFYPEPGEGRAPA